MPFLKVPWYATKPVFGWWLEPKKREIKAVLATHPLRRHWSGQGARPLCRPWFVCWRGYYYPRWVQSTGCSDSWIHKVMSSSDVRVENSHIALSFTTPGKQTALDLYDHKLDLDPRKCERLGVAERVQTQNDARRYILFDFDKICRCSLFWGLTPTSQTRHQIQ